MTTNRRIQFGAGHLPLPHPWENYDRDVDCAQPLDPRRFPDGCAEIVFSEMMAEHLKPQEAWTFLDGCYRILRPGGLIRIVIPDFSMTWKLKDPDWLRVNSGVTTADGSWKDNMRSVLFGHGHQGLWNSELLRDVLEAIGFADVRIHRAGESDRPELKGLEQHHKSVGEKVAYSESGCVEGVRP